MISAKIGIRTGGSGDTWDNSQPVPGEVRVQEKLPRGDIWAGEWSQDGGEMSVQSMRPDVEVRGTVSLRTMSSTV